MRGVLWRHFGLRLITPPCFVPYEGERNTYSSRSLEKGCMHLIYVCIGVEVIWGAFKCISGGVPGRNSCGGCENLVF